MYRFNSLKQKVEVRNLSEATPFSSVSWEKDQLVKTMNVNRVTGLNEINTIELNWNLFSERGLGLSKNGERVAGSDVAVIDTGIYDHVEFRAKLLKGFDFINDPALSFDGDGRDNDYAPEKNEDSSCPDVSGDIISHGTHVTGVIASEGISDKSNIGVSPNSNILPIRVLGPCGGSLIDVIDAMLWSAGVTVDGVPKNENIISVVNLSLGGYGKCPSGLQDAIDAILKKGVITVVAAGNSSLDLDSSDFFPANCKRVISVGATNINGHLSSYSNFGEKLIYAPGGDQYSGIYSTLVNSEGGHSGNFGTMVGTSMSAPHVSALVAIIKDRYPTIGIKSVWDILKSSSNTFGVASYKNLISLLEGEDLDVLNEVSEFETEPQFDENENNPNVLTCGSIDLGKGSGSGKKQAAFLSLLAGFFLFSLIENTRSRA